MNPIAEQCDSKVKHGQHEWTKAGGFKRWCKGLKRAAK